MRKKKIYLGGRNKRMWGNRDPSDLNRVPRILRSYYGLIVHLRVQVSNLTITINMGWLKQQTRNRLELREFADLVKLRHEIVIAVNRRRSYRILKEFANQCSELFSV